MGETRSRCRLEAEAWPALLQGLTSSHELVKSPVLPEQRLPLSHRLRLIPGAGRTRAAGGTEALRSGQKDKASPRSQHPP